ncbi:hypothetical protein J0S82_003249 [Galemys pyrenaicus]|uniref:Uncharacterized protein n=1 Tax=Galemys pyrenaicus TaxID=202257 RepID=A0A8J6DQ63_GALPY|nr:hypothetical protein J0S82_003249 [Galemys pyrenaicus]
MPKWACAMPPTTESATKKTGQHTLESVVDVSVNKRQITQVVKRLCDVTVAKANTRSDLMERRELLFAWLLTTRGIPCPPTYQFAQCWAFAPMGAPNAHKEVRLPLPPLATPTGAALSCVLAPCIPAECLEGKGSLVLLHPALVRKLLPGSPSLVSCVPAGDD